MPTRDAALSRSTWVRWTAGFWLGCKQKNVEFYLEQYKNSARSYFVFVDELIKVGFVNVIVTGATSPTISDSDQLGEVINARRRKVRATQAERTKVTLEFNNLLQENASYRNPLFVDVKDDVLDRATGLVSYAYRNRNPADHHMDANLAAAP